MSSEPISRRVITWENGQTLYWVERYREGDDSAADALFQRYARQVCAIAARRIGPQLRRRVEAGDVVHSVFRTFFRRCRAGEFAFERPGALWRLLSRMTLRKVLSQWEWHYAARRSVAAEAMVGQDQLPERLSAEPAPDDAAALADDVEWALADSRPRDAEIVRLCLAGYTTSEIADEMNVSRWTVRRVLDFIGQRLEARWRP